MKKISVALSWFHLGYSKFLSSCYRAVFWVGNENVVDNKLMFWFFVKTCLS